MLVRRATVTISVRGRIVAVELIEVQSEERTSEQDIIATSVRGESQLHDVWLARNFGDLP